MAKKNAKNYGKTFRRSATPKLGQVNARSSAKSSNNKEGDFSRFFTRHRRK